MLQGGVGLRVATLIDMQQAILGLYAPLSALRSSGSTGSRGGGDGSIGSGRRRESLHGGGSGAFGDRGDSAFQPPESSAPTSEAAAAIRTAMPVASRSVEPGIPLEADVSRRSGHAAAAGGSRRRSSRRASQVHLEMSNSLLHPSTLLCTCYLMHMQRTPQCHQHRCCKVRHRQSFACPPQPFRISSACVPICCRVTRSGVVRWCSRHSAVRRSAC